MAGRRGMRDWWDLFNCLSKRHYRPLTKFGNNFYCTSRLVETACGVNHNNKCWCTSISIENMVIKLWLCLKTWIHLKKGHHLPFVLYLHCHAFIIWGAGYLYRCSCLHEDWAKSLCIQSSCYQSCKIKTAANQTSQVSKGRGFTSGSENAPLMKEL